MDSETTLLIHGDHGMTVRGDHGGSSILEMSSILFAHQKTPFPMHQYHDDMVDAFVNMDRSIKILDVPAIVSYILDIPIPFVSLGVIHPAFSPTSDLKIVHKQMINNLK